jgi:hypothetical protein
MGTQQLRLRLHGDSLIVVRIRPPGEGWRCIVSLRGEMARVRSLEKASEEVLGGVGVQRIVRRVPYGEVRDLGLVVDIETVLVLRLLLLLFMTLAGVVVGVVFLVEHVGDWLVRYGLLGHTFPPILEAEEQYLPRKEESLGRAYILY